MASCAEVEFLAENQTIEIIPNFTMRSFNLFSGAVGPFEAGVGVEVPLWAAIFIKQSQKCRIVPPSWLKLEKLEEIKNKELEDKYFTPMPDVHYMESAQLILQHAPKDVEDGDKLKTVLQDIFDIRFAKLRSSIDIFVRSGQTHATVNHLTPMEICRIRNFLVSSLSHVQHIQNSYRTVDQTINSNTSQ